MLLPHADGDVVKDRSRRVDISEGEHVAGARYVGVAGNGWPPTS